MQDRNCPPRETLRAFSIGSIADEQLDAVAGHVADCSRCEDVLQGLDEESARDSFVASLQSCSLNVTGVSAVSSGVVEVARRAGRASSSAGSSLSLDPGKRYAKRLSEGPVLVGRFELEAELGVGSFGYVFRARDTELDRTVALKVQRAGSIASDEDVERFLREARSAAQLTHSGIVSLYETGTTDDGVCFLVTEFVEGETLEARQEGQSLNWQEIGKTVAELAEALDYAHGQGVVHRDIKPSNVLIDPAGKPHIMDFGLARRDTGDATLTSDGRVVGTPAYMSPEQARGESNSVDARSDLYSLGVMLYEMLTGERPFQGNRRMLLLQVLEADPRPPRQLNDAIPRDLETICLKAMSRTPARRYQSGKELADDLRRYLNGEPILARPLNQFERLWRWSHRYPLATSLFVALLVGSFAGFWHLFTVSDWFVHETALDSARREAAMIEEFNQYYSDVLGRLKPGTVKITHEYLKEEGCLPLPATFTIDAGERISTSVEGLRVRLCSDHPWRKDSEPKTEFQREALAILRVRAEQRDRDLTWHRFANDDGGQRSLFFAKGQLMKESCVKCHKKHPDSPRRNWEIGDLAGALVITQPLKPDIERTRDGMRGAFILLAVLVAVPTILGLVSVVVGSRKRLGI
jgi:eukaryotic-like serine/threonine-protein kinase